jgi:hypothetical protein
MLHCTVKQFTCMSVNMHVAVMLIITHWDASGWARFLLRLGSRSAHSQRKCLCLYLDASVREFAVLQRDR